VLEFGSEEALEVVLNDEYAEEVGVATGAEDIPGQGSERKAGDGDGVKAAEGVAPAAGASSPQQNCTTR